jgi:hypothetical protein
VFKPQEGRPKELSIPTGEFLGLLVFGGMTTIVFIIAFTLLLYLYYSLCIYLISKRLEVSYAWLSWVPVLQVLPLVGAARKPLWWTVFFLIPPALGFFSGLPFVEVLSMIAALAVLAVMVILWISITENLGLNRWFGLLAIVPLVQFLYLGYLAFKTEPEREFSIKRPLLISLGVYIFLVVIIAVGLNYIVMPTLSKAIKVSMESTIKEEVKQIEKTIEMLKDTSRLSGAGDFKERTATKTRVVILSGRDYERILSTKRVDFRGGSKVSLGPVALKILPIFGLR